MRRSVIEGDDNMVAANKHLVALLMTTSVTAFASQAFAQVDTQPRPPNPTSISEHRAMALKKCTDNIAFASDRYVACMQSEGEAP
jgi:hypothetical protein